jgi:hypothetical protein
MPGVPTSQTASYQRVSWRWQAKVSLPMRAHLDIREKNLRRLQKAMTDQQINQLIPFQRFGDACQDLISKRNANIMKDYCPKCGEIATPRWVEGSKEQARACQKCGSVEA